MQQSTLLLGFVSYLIVRLTLLRDSYTTGWLMWVGVILSVGLNAGCDVRWREPGGGGGHNGPQRGHFLLTALQLSSLSWMPQAEHLSCIMLICYDVSALERSSYGLDPSCHESNKPSLKVT